MEGGFGSTLRHARMRKGLELNEVARRLRIRPDVLKAIEESNFDAMPPRGYARNMINSYARLLGLNASEITGRYLDEQYAHQIGSARKPTRGTGFDMSGADRHHHSSAAQHRDRYEVSGYDAGSSESRQAARSRSDSPNRATRQSSRMRDGQSNRFGRREYAADFDEPHPTGRTHDRNELHRSRGNALDEGRYLNAYSGPTTTKRGLRDRIPLVAIIAVVAVLLIILLVLLFGPKNSSSSSSVTNMPVNGAEKAASSSTTATAPTSFKFTYTVASGSSSWIEVYIDDEAQVAETVEGPATQTFTCSSNLEFICSNTDGVTATQDGTALDLTPDENSGIVDLNISFSTVLSQWQQAHGVSSSSTSSASASTATATSTSSAA